MAIWRHSAELAVFVTIALAIPAFAFATDSADGDTGSSDQPSAADASSDTEIPAGKLEAGRKLYLANCRVCHGTNGSAGVPLAGNAKVASGDYLAKTVITGPGYMAAFGDHLSDEEIATIVTYVANSWGNDFGPTSAEQVAAQR